MWLFFFTEIFRPLLQLMNADHGFLKADPNFWQQHGRYISAHSLCRTYMLSLTLQNMPLVY